jgi:signal transduction histidine kinase
MRSIFPSIRSKPEFNLDFSLTYAGIIFLGFSIASTEMFQLYPESKTDVIEIRLIHTLYLIISVLLAQVILKKLKRNTAGYLGLALIGLSIAIPSLIVRVFLMQSYGLISASQVGAYFFEQMSIILLQAFFWIPIVIILGGQRSRIFEAFKEYEKRLVVTARKNIRNSAEFIQLKKQVDQDYKEELNQHAHLLMNSLNFGDKSSFDLGQRNEIIQRYLKNNTLKDLSRTLNQKSEAVTNNSKFNQDMHSLNLISKQFNILYNFVARKSPLPAGVYTTLSFALIFPNYVHFFTIQQFLLSMPFFLVIHLIAIFINRVLLHGGKFAILQSNLLTLLIGFLPFLEMLLFRAFLPNQVIEFPILTIAIFYPLGFFVYIRFCQIIQPEAVAAIRSDEIYTSHSLNTAISKIVRDEFKQSMSHQWATFIHGKILTRLAATSLKLQQAVDHNDLENFESGLKNLKTILDNPTAEFDQNLMNLKSEIASRLDPWEGLITIKVSVDPVLEMVTNDRVKDLGEVIEEIISNSVRHGGSQNISIIITSSDHPDIKLVIEDDAINPLPLVPVRIGLGTKILNLVSDGRWSISHVDAKSTVKLTMSLLDN